MGSGTNLEYILSPEKKKTNLNALLFSGVHHHNKKDCEATNAVQRVLNILSGAAKYLFPKSVITKNLPLRKKLKVPRGNGGWGDIRDKTLCLSMASTFRGEDDVEAALQIAKDKINSVEEDKAAGNLPL